MKTTKFLFATIFGLTITFSNAQNVQSNALATSGGLNAGTTASGTGKNTFYGYQAGKVNTSGSNNSFIGNEAGILNTTGYLNTFLGSYSGTSNSTGVNNTFIGSNSGRYFTTGSFNVIVGSVGDNFLTGTENTFVGYNSGGYNGTGNVFLGSHAGFESDGDNNNYLGANVGSQVIGSDNVFVGRDLGTALTGSGNVLIGRDMGYNMTIDDTFILQTQNNSPLLYGDFVTGKLGLGITSFPSTAGSVDVSAYKLFVPGGILTEAVRVNLISGWADYVFAADYKLPTLSEVEKHIIEKGHLINVPSEVEIVENGIDLVEMAKIQQEKIEELTLYIIDQNKINERQNRKLEKQSQEIEELKSMVLDLKKSK